MPEGTFKCDKCGNLISNPQKDPKYCPHATRCGKLNLCNLTSASCEATKLALYCGMKPCPHPDCVPPSDDLRPKWPAPSPEKTWPVHRVKRTKSGTELIPWNLETNKPLVSEK